MRRERGAVFIIALAALVGLVAILVSVAATQRQAVRAQANRTELDRARIAADAGIARAMAEISVREVNQPTLSTDEWAILGNGGDDRFIVGGGTFRLQILDLTAGIDINTATEDQLRTLALTTGEIESLLDWRETNREPRIEGAKDEYYNNLPRPYNTKLRRFDTVDELLLVKGFTPEILFQPRTDVVATATASGGQIDSQIPLSQLFVVDAYAPNTTTTGQAKLNVNAPATTAPQLAQRLGITVAQATNIVAGRPYARVGAVISRPGVPNQAFGRILDEITTSGATRIEGRINLNTAPEEVLLSVPGLTPDVVQAILQRQSSGFSALSDLVQIPGLNGAATLSQVADLFTTESDSFLIRVVGEAGEARYPMEAVVVIEDGQPRRLRANRYPLADYLSRWNWAEEPSQEITLKERE